MCDHSNKNQFVSQNELHNVISHIDSTLESNIDFMQLQINEINNSYIDIYKSLILNNKQNELIVDKIQYLYEYINEIKTECCNHTPCDSEKRYTLFTDTDKTHFFKIKDNMDMIFITMVAGGGAGGIGCVENMYYCAGGGGGGGACIIKKPVSVTPKTIIKITVGRGGNKNINIDGQDTNVEIITPELNSLNLKTGGGANGNPDYRNTELETNTSGRTGPEMNTSGGKGGYTDLVSILRGNDGENGGISIPSQTSAISGNGGSSILNMGGKGGGNYFSSGGTGGSLINIIGEDGNYGSGGGGSAPRVKININDKLSGNGGDGMVLIEW